MFNYSVDERIVVLAAGNNKYEFKCWDTNIFINANKYRW